MNISKNSRFEKILEEISRIINNSIDCNLSILLIGSYGRDDGKFDKNGYPLRDIDLVIVLTKNRNVNILKIKQNLQNSKLLLNLVVDLHFYTINSLIDVYPFWRFYDIKHNSKLILGKDIRKTICNFNSSNISEYDGLRMLAGEIVKIIREKTTEESKLYFILKSAENIKNGCYGRKVRYDKHKISMDEFIQYALEYYKGGYIKSAKCHLQPTINYIIKKKFYLNIKRSFIFSIIIQVYWTIVWAKETKNFRVLYDWRDPALRIIYSIFYYFRKDISEKQKLRLFEKVSFPKMEYSRGNLLMLYEIYFQGNKWKSVRKSNWTSNSQVIIK